MNRGQREQLKEFLHRIDALIQSMETSVRADPANMWKYAGYKQYILHYNHLLEAVSRVIPVGDAVLGLYDAQAIPGIGDTSTLQQKEFFDSVHANLSLLRAFLESKLDLKADEITNLRDFLQANLRRAVQCTPKMETQVQDVVEHLLIGRGLSKGLDYDRETGRVKQSIKESVPDFIFPRLSLALEVKLAKDKPKSRAIVDEINADIKAYGKAYANMLFVVYDLGTIRDEAEFRQDLEAADGVAVIVIKH